MSRIAPSLTVLLACVSICLADEPKFAEGPAVSPTVSGGWAVAFAVDRLTDVAVAVVDKEGKVVRRLAHGVLGANAPAPFQKGSLAQTIAWDGKDDAGKAAPPGCSVRVGLGTRAVFDRVLRTEQQGLASRGAVAIAVDDQGVMYAVHGHLWVAHITTMITIGGFDREGNFLKTIEPFRADWPREKVSAVEWLKLADGRAVPLSAAGGHRPYNGFIPGIPGLRRMQALVSREGQLILAGGRPFKMPGEDKANRRLIAIGTDGSAQADKFYGPILPPGGGDAFLAFSPDQKYIYVSGLTGKSGPVGVYRVQWADKDPPAKPFIGGERGDGDGQFNEPRGVAVARDGRIAVGDYLNDRVQVFGADGRFLASRAVPGPDTVLVNPKTGEVYVLSVRDRGKRSSYADVTWEVFGDKSIVKFKSLDDWTETARIDLPPRERHFHDSPPMLALDLSGPKAQIWAGSVGRQDPDDFLWRIADAGDKLVRQPHKVVRFERLRGVEIDPKLAGDPIHNCFYVLDEGRIFRYDAATGRPEEFKLQLPADLKPSADKKTEFAPAVLRVGPDGLLYVRARTSFDAKVENRVNNWIICRFDAAGKLAPFAKAGAGVRGFGRHAGEQRTDFDVAPDGSLYVSEYTGPRGPYCRVNHYHADGSFDRTVIAEMTRSGGSLAVGPGGELYVAEAVRPANKTVPDFVGGDPRNHFRMWYGTLARFDPAKGGDFVAGAGEGLDIVAQGRGPGKLTGALWTYYGTSPFSTEAGCECSQANLDADRFGRIFAPDLCTYSIQVLDSAGNLACRFGAYGNFDSQGPKSAAPVPPVPLWYPREVAVIDDAVAIADVNNRRTIQVKLTFAASKDVPVK